ncbi:MAG TPA: hypothetical protein VM055_02420 [Novosphingobium sp.]|nr:hypothetical protein [Novosphingobium sp.]
MNAARRRGQPLAMLALVLGAWATARVALWESPFPAEGPAGLALDREADADFIATRPIPARSSEIVRFAAPRFEGAHRARAFAPIVPRQPALSSDPPLPLAPPERTLPPLAPPRVIAGHQLMMLAALGRLGLPPLLASDARQPLVVDRSQPSAAPALVRASRWSGDGWMLLRRGSDGIGAAPGFARYGASQAGAVLRYSLAPRSVLRPQAHVRLARALGGFDEGEAAAGVSLRPLAAVPLRLLGEGRVQRSGGRARLRPALAAISELPPLALPLGGDAELYAAAGYVGGQHATPFFDAQLTAERAVIARGLAELRLGAGAWAGGQEGAARLDLGPRASVRLRLGEAPSRLALDWRFRVAGKAAPASGPALTFSAGF